MHKEKQTQNSSCLVRAGEGMYVGHEGDFNFGDKFMWPGHLYCISDNFQLQGDSFVCVDGAPRGCNVPALVIAWKDFQCFSSFLDPPFPRYIHSLQCCRNTNTYFGVFFLKVQELMNWINPVAQTR